MVTQHMQQPRKRLHTVLVAVLLIALQIEWASSAPSDLVHDDQSKSRLLEIGEAGEDEIGIAMAGGSFRAASACYGILRGLTQKKIIDQNTGENVPAMDFVAYNSGISGGSIPAILYAFAGVPTKELLETDRTTDPSKISKEELSRMPKTSMGFVIAQKPDVQKITIHFLVTKLFNPFNLLKWHKLWAGGFHEKVCKPMNIPKNKYITSSKEELEKILQENPKLKKSDFLLPRGDIKTNTMILTTMHGSRADNNAYMKKYQAIRDEAWNEYKAQETLAYFTNSFEKRPNMTDIVLSVRDKHGGNLPMPYVITPDVVENKYSGKVLVHKKMIQFPEKNVRPFEWGSKKGRYGRNHRLSVEVLTSMSTNFPGSSVTLLGQFFTNIRKINLSDGSEVTQRLADGGTNDLMGIIPLVARGTKNIISVYIFNQNPPITTFADSYADIYKVANATSLEDPDFDEHFRRWISHINPRFTCLFGFFNTHKINHGNIMNHVFHDPNIDRLKELMVKYNSLFMAGEPLVVTLKDLKVIDNPFWGVKGGKTIDLTLIYFNMPKKFSERVPEDAVPPPGEEMSKIDKYGRFTNEEFRVVPELSTEGVAQVSYTTSQVNMMGYLGSWMIHHSWDGLKGHDGEVAFDGFDKMFMQA